MANPVSEYDRLRAFLHPLKTWRPEYPVILERGQLTVVIPPDPGIWPRFLGKTIRQEKISDQARGEAMVAIADRVVRYIGTKPSPDQLTFFLRHYSVLLTQLYSATYESCGCVPWQFLFGATFPLQEGRHVGYGEVVLEPDEAFVGQVTIEAEEQKGLDRLVFSRAIGESIQFRVVTVVERTISQLSPERTYTYDLDTHAIEIQVKNILPPAQRHIVIRVRKRRFSEGDISIALGPSTPNMHAFQQFPRNNVGVLAFDLPPATRQIVLQIKTERVFDVSVVTPATRYRVGVHPRGDVSLRKTPCTFEVTPEGERRFEELSSVEPA
jgi:hypothetical protein